MTSFSDEITEDPEADDFTFFEIATNKPINGRDISPGEFEKMVSSGGIYSKSKKVRLRDRETGKVRRLDVTSPHFFEDIKGLRPFTEGEIKESKAREFARTIPGYAASAGAGLLRGATLSASDVALEKLGVAEKETLRALAEENPLLSGASEIAGSVIPILPGAGAASAAVKGAAAKAIAKEGAKEAGEKAAKEMLEVAAKNPTMAKKALSGIKRSSSSLPGAVVRTIGAPAIAAERAAQAIGSSVASRTGSRTLGAVARGAADGAIFSSAANLSREYLEENPDLSVQSILGDIGLSSLIGGAISGSLTYASSRFNKSKSRVAEKAQKVISESADEADIVSALRLSKEGASVANALNLKIPQIDALARAGDRASAVRNFEEASLKIMKMKLPDGSPVIRPGDSRKVSPDRFIAAFDAIGDRLKSVYSDMRAKGEVSDQSAAQFISKAISDANSLKKNKAFGDRYIAKVKEILGDAVAPYADNPVLSASDLSEIKDSLIDHAKAYSRSGSPIEVEAATKISRQANELLEEMAFKKITSDKQRTAFKNDKRDFAQLKRLAYAVSRRSDMTGMHADIGLLDTINAGSVADFATLGANLARATGVDAGLATLGAFAARSATRKGLAALRDKIPSVKAVDAYEKAGLIESGRKASSMVGRVASTLYRIGSLADKENSKFAKKMLSKSVKRSAEKSAVILSSLALSGDPRMGEKRKVQRAAQNLRYLQQQTASRYRMEEYIGNSLADGATEFLHSRYIGVSSRAITALLSSLPPDPYPPLVFGMTPNAKSKSLPSAASVKRFTRMIEALESPGLEISRAAMGDVNMQSLDAVKYVYPDLYAKAMKSLSDGLRKRKTALNASERALYGILLKGTPYEISYEQFSDLSGSQVPEGSQASSTVGERKSERITTKALDIMAKNSQNLNTFTETLGTSTPSY